MPDRSDSTRSAPASPIPQVDSESGACRYCGILPDQDLPRPSYSDLRARYAEALRLLAVPISEMDAAYGAECDYFLSRALSGRSGA